MRQRTEQPNRSYRGHDVVDRSHRLIGTISDVLCDDDGDARWAVVDLGLLHSMHYLPVDDGYMSRRGEFVVPYDKTMVKTSPPADRRPVVGPDMTRRLEAHYRLG